MTTPITLDDLRRDVADTLVDEFGVARAAIDFTATYDEMGIDSLVVLELAMVIESKHRIKVTEQELSEAHTLDGVVELLGAKREVTA